MEQPNKQPIEPVQNSKNIWITIIVVIITALIVDGGIYAWQRSNLKSTEQNLQKQIYMLQNQINNLGHELSLQNQMNMNTSSQSDKIRPIFYKNLEYGFTLIFPQTWEGYIAQDRILDWGVFGTSNSIDFGFPIQNSLFNISIYTKKQWRQIQSEGGPKPLYLGENDQYIFGYAISPHNAENDEVLARSKELTSIIQTFSLD